VNASVVAGIFVGGAATRMGGQAKGLMRASDGRTIVDRWLAILAAAGVLDVVLVGSHPAYAGLGLAAIHDEPPGIGPLGGLASLLRRAGDGRAIAVACDMPFVSSALVERLLVAPAAPVVAPRRDGRWEPLCARYDAARVLPFAIRRAGSRDHSLQRLLDDSGASELPIAPHEANELRDWDAPEDLLQSPVVSERHPA
jgi:molybdopterin-guanine dinucleotide biosynthesis protein A